MLWFDMQKMSGAGTIWNQMESKASRELDL